MQHVRRLALIFGLIVTLLAVGIIFKDTSEKRRLPMEPTQPETNEFSLTSPVFANNQPIPALYTCKGENTRPPLEIGHVPTDAKSLALILHDPDAVNGDWAHWTIWNISPSTTSIDEKAYLPGSVEGTTSFGKPGYGGPCPPAGTGTHHYIFELYALKESLNLDAKADRTQLEAEIKQYQIAHTTLTGLFKAD